MILLLLLMFSSPWLLFLLLLMMMAMAIETMTWFLSQVNKFKNRLVNILPFESSRVCLQPLRWIEDLYHDEDGHENNLAIAFQ